MELVYQGFDGFEVSFQGFFLPYIRYQLEKAKEQAQNDRKPALALLGDSEIPVHVAETGMKGGFKYMFDTGPDREKWFVADSDKSERWNIRVSVHSLSMALHGYYGVKRNILNFLKEVGAQGCLEDFSLLERISRFDYCFDFATDDFSINPRCIAAHSGITRQFIGNAELITRNKDIEYMRLGKMPSRQIVFYDKTKEITKRGKDYWWDLWNLNKDEFNKKIWRVEIRAGKRELDTWNLKRFSDFEEKSGDVLRNIANSIRYVSPNYKDSNKARWKNKPFWDELLNALDKDLIAFSSNAKRGAIIHGLKNDKINDYKMGFLYLVAPYMALTDTELNDLPITLNELVSFIEQEFHASPDIFEERYTKAKERFTFLK